MDRTIFHIDMNGCYAGIECLYNPSIRDKPVAVGGSVEERHGIILAKNEIAKKYNIKTGEALWQARKKCPELVIVPPHYDRYTLFSKLARKIYADYSDLVEPFGLDECWVDVTGTLPLLHGAETLADEIRLRVKRELGITVSVGVSYNKVFAKLGSDYKKPDAVTVFTRENYKELVWSLPASDLLYVGPATKRALQSVGVLTIGDLAKAEPELLTHKLGKAGLTLRAFANGEDKSPVEHCEAETAPKSIGCSTTPPRDLSCDADANLVFYLLCESVAERLRQGGFLCRTVQIHMRDSLLQTSERQLRLDVPTCLSTELHAAAMGLLRESHDWRLPLRSIGVRAANLIPADTPVQTSVFESEEKRSRRESLERSVDGIRRRFGSGAVARLVCLSDPVLGGSDADAIADYRQETALSQLKNFQRGA